MAVLRSASGLILPQVARSGAPLLNSPVSMKAPVIIAAPADLLFNMTTARPGVPAVNDQFENFKEDREWALCFNHPTEGFAGIRWQPTWLRSEGFYGSWEPATATIYRVQRKGATGQDARTLVFTCGPNTAKIPAGEKIVVWRTDYEGDVRPLSSLNLSGYNLPLRSKMTVTSCTPSAAYDTSGRRIIEVDAGTDLPAIDFTPSDVQASYYSTTNLNLRHWAFYKDTAAKALRHPLGWFSDISINNVIANGGYIMLGGSQFIPTYVDWTNEYYQFGASLIEELYRLEAEGLANYLGDTDPRKLCVELENEPTAHWADVGSEPGYGTLLRDVYYPTVRQAWGVARTIVVKSTSFGGMDSLRGEFDFANPGNGNNHLAIHNYDGQISWPNGKINFAGGDQTEWVATELKNKINALGYKGGGMSEMGVAPYEFYDYSPVADDERGRRLGRMLTSLSSRDLSIWVWGAVGDAYRCAGVETIDTHRIEAYWATVRPYARRAGVTPV